MGLDIGPAVLQFSEALKGAATVWNGPMGVFEQEPLPRARWRLAGPWWMRGVLVIGGGDTIARPSRRVDKIGSSLDAGGGSSLEGRVRRASPP